MLHYLEVGDETPSIDFHGRHEGRAQSVALGQPDAVARLPAHLLQDVAPLAVDVVSGVDVEFSAVGKCAVTKPTREINARVGREFTRCADRSNYMTSNTPTL